MHGQHILLEKNGMNGKVYSVFLTYLRVPVSIMNNTEQHVNQYAATFGPIRSLAFACVIDLLYF